MNPRKAIVSTLFIATGLLAAADADRWEISPEGGIQADAAKLTRGQPHADHLEMGGRMVNAIIRWNVTGAGCVELDRWVRWPMLREKKDDTHAAANYSFRSQDDPLPLIDGAAYQPAQATDFRIHGMLAWKEAGVKVSVARTAFPSVSLPCLLERWEIKNLSTQPVEIQVPSQPNEELQPRAQFLWAAHRIRSESTGGGRYRLMPGEQLVTGMVFSSREDNQPVLFPNLAAEWAARDAFIGGLEKALVLTTGDAIVDRLFACSKLRAAENVLATRGGLMHAPGGFNRYLAALWCNDQNEYVSPFFPFLGDAAGNESARNAYLWFAKYMNPEYKPLPSSIVAEGRGIWNGAGDRGDAAMTAYGASRWALATGDAGLAREVWPLIEWCLEFCERRKTAQGVIASNTDELEGRFSAGQANLATSGLTYDALLSAAYLAEALGSPKEKAETYRQRAANLSQAIERVFGTKIGSYETYRYHEGLEKLRAWICLPLVMDLHARAQGTVEALFSPDLWTQDGLLTEAGTTTFWDRSTLYALRGVFRAGQPDRAAEYLDRFARRRLLGDHVPYCVEAFPEQNQSHLSAESGLYCRIFTEGVCGIRPTGFDTFRATPRIPRAWPGVKLTNIHAFGRVWDFQSARNANGMEVVVSMGGKTCYRATQPEGSEHLIKLP
ncbi:MAG: hypothetical protein WCQ21_05835 [Verrucomicrobiota bacterium]